MRFAYRLWIVLAVGLCSCGIAAENGGSKKSYRIPPANLKDRVIWGSTCEAPDGSALSCGGQDQESDDGTSHTRFRPAAGEWIELFESLQKDDPLRDANRDLKQGLRQLKKTAGLGRRTYFDQLPIDRFNEEARAVETLAPRIAKAIADILPRLPQDSVARQRGSRAIKHLNRAAEESKQLGRADAAITGGDLARLAVIERELQHAADAISVEPPARALSPIVYEPKTGLFLLFGGDHCDYLTNDTWAFDPASKQWRQSDATDAPPPRAGHAWKSLGNGKLALRGGYTYTSSTEYCGSQYAELEDGEWIFDVEANRWSAPPEAKLVADDARTYRGGPFDPKFYWRDPQPSRPPFDSFLQALPVNVWTLTKPPHLPQLNRDWGTAVYDSDHDLILRFSGGHSAHGGSDVLQYHCKTNRWELCFPVEFPLGQLYSNTSYPGGFNFNRRPWVTGHTYQNYGYDQTARRMLFTGQTKHAFSYDPEIGDWDGRIDKPAGMAYDSCFYTLTACPTPAGLVAWTNQGKLFRFEANAHKWRELELRGGKLPGSEVDNSTLVYDSRRERLIFARKPYGEPPFDGVLHAVDLKTLEVTRLEPAGYKAASAISYLCQLRYDGGHDLVLGGCTLPADGSGLRRTPAYDCESNRWVSLVIRGDDPSGPKGRNVSLGLMYDAGRKLFWAVDTNSRVYVLRLEPESADVQPLE